MVFSQSSTSINNPSISYSDDTHRSSRDSGGDSRDSRRRSVFDVLKRSRSVSAAPPDNRSIPGQYPESSTTPPLATVDTQILRHRTRLSPGLTAENIKAGGQSRLGGILRRRDASPTESTPGATPDTQKAQSSSNNSPYLSRFIGTEDSESESDGESIYQTSEDPPRLLFPLTRSRSNSMTTFMRSFNFDGTRDSPPRPLPSPTRSQTSFVLVEHEARRIQDQDSHLPTSLPPVSREVTRDRTAEASERKEFVPGRKSPQEVLSSMGVYRRETQEGSPLWTGGSATVIGTQQRQQRHEPDPPPTPSSSKVPWDAERNIQGYIDDIDTRLGSHIQQDRERQKLFNDLCKACSRYQMLPTSMYIPDCSQGAVEAAYGGSATVWQSMYKGVRVAVKVFRMFVTSDMDDLLSRFCREGVAWKHLRHPNILPLLGVTIDKHRFSMVSEWMDNGNINQFIEKYPHANRPMLLVDVASGLKYLHDLQIVHGDLKGANILINREKRACLADFGLVAIDGAATRAVARSSQVSLFSINSLMPFTPGGTYRWMSPELLDPEAFGIPQSEESSRPTTQSDCYAFGMVIYEILCGHHPFVDVPTDILVMNAITNGVRPEKPEGAARLGFTDELWGILERCWLEDRSARPSVEEILPYLNDAWYMMTMTPDSSASHASTPSQSQGPVQVDYMCERCGTRPKCRKGDIVYPYCGLRCAKSGPPPVRPPMNPPNPPLFRNAHPAQPQTTFTATICHTPDCVFPAFTNANGTLSKYCSITHKRLGEYGCIWCRAAPSNSVFILCQPCHDNAMLMAPMIINMPEDHTAYKSVAKQFQQSWKHNTPCPQVRAVYKIISTEQSLKQYQQYLDAVEARGKFKAMNKQPGNENRRWHGARRKCYIGDSGVTTFCNDPGCSLCCILQRSYDLDFYVKGGMFGTGIYTSSASSKSNDYSKNVDIHSEWKAMLLNKVVVGYGKKLTQRNQALIAPPPGYDSVLGEVSPGHLNYDRLVVYNNDAVRPSYLVMYQPL